MEQRRQNQLALGFFSYLRSIFPLVAVVNHANPMASDLNHSRLFKSRTGMTPNAYRLTA